MKPVRIFSILVAAIATSFSFLLSPVAVTASASDQSHTIETMPDETSLFRFSRQTYNKNRGILWQLADYIKQTRDETMTAFNQISDVVSRQIVPEKQLNKSAPVTQMNLTSNASTTAAPIIITQEEVQRFLRRSIKGLVRVFNMESRRAIEDSNNNVRILREEFMDAVRPFFVRNTTRRNA